MAIREGGVEISFFYNAYLYVGHFEEPAAVVNAIMSGDIPRDRYHMTTSGHVTHHVSCLAAIMMFRLSVHHPIHLKKFDLNDIINSSYRTVSSSNPSSCEQDAEESAPQNDRYMESDASNTDGTRPMYKCQSQCCCKGLLSSGCKCRETTHRKSNLHCTCMSYRLLGRRLSQDVGYRVVCFYFLPCLKICFADNCN